MRCGGLHSRRLVQTRKGHHGCIAQHDPHGPARPLPVFVPRHAAPHPDRSRPPLHRGGLLVPAHASPPASAPRLCMCSGVCWRVCGAVAVAAAGWPAGGREGGGHRLPRPAWEGEDNGPSLLLLLRCPKRLWSVVQVLPVGDTRAKIQHARRASVDLMLVPASNVEVRLAGEAALGRRSGGGSGSAAGGDGRYGSSRRCRAVNAAAAAAGGAAARLVGGGGGGQGLLRAGAAPRGGSTARPPPLTCSSRSSKDGL